MKEHPILFNTEMVKAILAGKKTMTRRPIKPQPKRILATVSDGSIETDLLFRGNNQRIFSSFGRVGDRLWVKETWNLIETLVSPIPIPDKIVYRASPETYIPYPGIAWRSPIFMPRRASRITLEIIGLKVEKVQEITDEDAMAEGVGMGMPDNFVWIRGRAIQKFRSLWDILYDKKGYGWDTNPWVWVIEFKRIEEAE